MRVLFRYVCVFVFFSSRIVSFRRCCMFEELFFVSLIFVFFFHIFFMIFSFFLCLFFLYSYCSGGREGRFSSSPYFFAFFPPFFFNDRLFRPSSTRGRFKCYSEWHSGLQQTIPVAVVTGVFLPPTPGT